VLILRRVDCEREVLVEKTKTFSNADVTEAIREVQDYAIKESGGGEFTENH